MVSIVIMLENGAPSPVPLPKLKEADYQVHDTLCTAALHYKHSEAVAYWQNDSRFFKRNAHKKTANVSGARVLVFCFF